MTFPVSLVLGILATPRWSTADLWPLLVAATLIPLWSVRIPPMQDIWQHLALVDVLRRVAGTKRATPAQVAIAWLLARKPWIVPIPGTTKLSRLEENLGAADVRLTAEDLRDIDESAAKIPVQGARLPESILKLSYR